MLWRAGPLSILAAQMSADFELREQICGTKCLRSTKRRSTALRAVVRGEAKCVGWPAVPQSARRAPPRPEQACKRASCSGSNNYSTLLRMGADVSQHEGGCVVAAIPRACVFVCARVRACAPARYLLCLSLLSLSSMATSAHAISSRSTSGAMVSTYSSLLLRMEPNSCLATATRAPFP